MPSKVKRYRWFCIVRGKMQKIRMTQIIFFHFSELYSSLRRDRYDEYISRHDRDRYTPERDVKYHRRDRHDDYDSDYSSRYHSDYEERRRHDSRSSSRHHRRHRRHRRRHRERRHRRHRSHSSASTALVGTDFILRSD